MILLTSPAPNGSLFGNGVTAARWTAILERLGHVVMTARDYHPGEYELLIALHARKSAAAIRQFRALHPDVPVVLALTGTDLYPDLCSTGVDPDVLRIADRLVVLQEEGLAQLDDDLRPRGRVIIQSVPLVTRGTIPDDCFQVAYLSHLRDVKDPLCAAAATRLLPDSSRVQVIHAGHGIDAHLSEATRGESRSNPRYRWIGPVCRDSALELLASSRLMLLTSHHEGGANVVSEAIAAGVPVLSSRIPGSIGLLGADYPGFFRAGHPVELAALITRAEEDQGFLGELQQRIEVLRPMVHPQTELDAWASLLEELRIPSRRMEMPS